MSTKLSPDVILRESEQEYRRSAQKHLTSHQLADFRKCPLLYWQKKEGLVPDEDRPAYLIGRAAHMLILEGRERFDAEYTVGGPINARTGKPYGANTQAYADWAAAQGKPVITDEQLAVIVNLATGVRSHRLALDLLSKGVAEGVGRAEYCGKPCQIRVDWVNPDAGLVDLKTCDDLTWFEADARRYGYVHQMAFYQAVLAVICGVKAPVYFLAVEKKEPFRCGLWQVSEQTLGYAARENEAAIARLKQCAAEGAFPTGYEECRVFDSI